MGLLAALGGGEGLGALLGGIGGLFRKKPAVRTPADSLISHARGARAAAEETGFNPLTLLGVGNAGYQEIGSMGSSSFIGDAMNAVGSWFSNIGKDREAQKARLNERARIEASDPQPYRDFGYALNTKIEEHAPVAVSLPPSHGLAEMPGYWRDERGDTRMFVQAPDGGHLTIPADVGERLGLRPWGNLTSGDWTEIVGEGVGEVQSAAAYPQISDHLLRRGFFQNNVPLFPKPKPKKKAGAYDWWDGSAEGFSAGDWMQ